VFFCDLQCVEVADLHKLPTQLADECGVGSVLFLFVMLSVAAWQHMKIDN
jgi:hypothetical protein